MDVRADALLVDESDFLRNLARALLRSAAEAEDAVQETWLRTLRKYRERLLDRGLLVNVLRKVVSERRRGQERIARRERAAASSEAVRATPLDMVHRLDVSRLAIEAVQRLREPQRTIVVRRFHDGLEPVAIARELGLNDSTVRSHLHRALASLRDDLDRRGGGREMWVSALLPLVGDRTPVAAPDAAPTSGAAVDTTVATTKLFVAASPSSTAGVLVLGLLALLGLGGAWYWIGGSPDAGSADDPASAVAPAADEGGVRTGLQRDELRAMRVASAPGDADGAADGRGAASPAPRPATPWWLSGRVVGLVPGVPVTGEVVVTATPLRAESGTVVGRAAVAADGSFEVDLQKLGEVPVGTTSVVSGGMVLWDHLDISFDDAKYGRAACYEGLVDDSGKSVQGPFTCELRTGLAAMIRGRVIDERGDPVVGIRVTLLQRLEPHLYFTTSGDGDFVFKSYARGEHPSADPLSVIFACRPWTDIPFEMDEPFTGHYDEVEWMQLDLDAPPAAHFAARAVPVSVAPGAEVDLGDITLVRGASIRGGVAGIDGRALAGVLVIAAAETEVAGRTLHQLKVARTDSAGLYEIAGLTEGDWRVWPQNPTDDFYRERPAGVEPITVAAPAIGVDFEVPLSIFAIRTSAPASAEGSVHVRWLSQKREEYRSHWKGRYAGEDGTVHLMVDRSLPLSIWVSGPDCCDVVRELTPEALELTEELAIELEPFRAATLRVKAETDSGQPLSTAKFLLRRPGSPELRWESTGNGRLEPCSYVFGAPPITAPGRFELNGIEPGPWQITIRGERPDSSARHYVWFEIDEVVVDLAPGELEEISVRARTMGLLEFDVGDDLDPELGIDAEAVVLNEGREVVAREVVRKRGDARGVLSLRPGKVFCRVTAAGYLPWEAGFEIRQLEMEEVKVRLLRAPDWQPIREPEQRAREPSDGE